MTASQLMMLVRIMDLLAFMLTKYPEIKAQYHVLTGKLQLMVKEDRDPTPEEWAELEATTDSLHARLQAIETPEESPPTTEPGPQNPDELPKPPSRG